MLRKIKVLVVLFLLSSVFFSLSNSAFAESKEEIGLIKPVRHPEKLSEKQINSTLNEMGFTKEEVKKMRKETKVSIVSRGGKKVNFDLKPRKYYTNKDGIRYEVTNENKDEINQMKINDIFEYSNETNISVLNLSPSPGWGSDYLEDDYLYMATYVTKVPSNNSLEHKYAVYFDWSWSARPVAYFTDTAAIAWDEDFKGIANSYGGYSIYEGYDNSHRMDFKPEVYGLSVDFPINGQAFDQWGGIAQDIVVPKSKTGLTGRIVAAYVHSLTLFDFGVSIGPASIEPKFAPSSEEFYLDMNIIIGDDYPY